MENASTRHKHNRNASRLDRRIELSQIELNGQVRAESDVVFERVTAERAARVDREAEQNGGSESTECAVNWEISGKVAKGGLCAKCRTEAGRERKRKKQREASACRGQPQRRATQRRKYADSAFRKVPVSAASRELRWLQIERAKVRRAAARAGGAVCTGNKGKCRRRKRNR